VKDILSSSIVLGLCNVIKPCLPHCSALPKAFSIQNGLDWNLCHTAHFPVVDELLSRMTSPFGRLQAEENKFLSLFHSFFFSSSGDANQKTWDEFVWLF